MAMNTELILSWATTIVEIVRIILTTLAQWIFYSIQALIPAFYFPKKDVSGHIVLISGGGSGLGRQLAVKFAKNRAKVIILDVNDSAAQDTVSLVQDQQPNCPLIKYYKCDVSDRHAVYRTADEIRREIGDVDILINNAGIYSGNETVTDKPDELIIKTMQVNCLAHFWTVKAFLPRMKERNFGHIVTVSSAAGIIALNRMTDYCASKYACLGFHESLGVELHELGLKNIQTTLVCPYFINTGMFSGVTTKFSSTLPIMEPEYVANRMFEAILMNQKMVSIPRFLNVFYLLKSLMPIQVMYELGKNMEVTKSLDNFNGNSKN